MNNNELNSVLVRYLQLCEAFLSSDTFWSDESKQAIELLNRGDIIIESWCPSISLYKSMLESQNLLDGILKGKSIDKDVYAKVRSIAEKIDFNFDKDRSVKSVLTTNGEIKVNMWITEYLNTHYQIGDDVVINRDYFRKITDYVIKELKD